MGNDVDESNSDPKSKIERVMCVAVSPRSCSLICKSRIICGHCNFFRLQILLNFFLVQTMVAQTALYGTLSIFLIVAVMVISSWFLLSSEVQSMQKVKEPDPKPKRPAHLIDGERTEPKSCTLVLVTKPLQSMLTRLRIKIKLKSILMMGCIAVKNSIIHNL